ncbi:MAG: LysM peptidoglycan-binding domain-containing protein [Porphyromonadaceae bacterium]|nr:MAG: LysM peptidoglycan-binding domain-containing protein [Porphyromonadaceae bacterium]
MSMNVRKIFRNTLSVILLGWSTLLMGQQTTNLVTIDSVNPAKDPVYQQYLQRLDSLYLAWQNNRLPVRFYQDTALAFRKDNNIPDLPDSVFIKRLAGIPSAIELTYNKQVRSYLDLYTKSRRKQVSIMLGLSDYYFPMIESKLDACGLPLELKYLPIIESALNPVARSRVGAQGMWQFMLGTAKLYKLNVNSFIDERLDPERSTEVACAYLKELYSIFGDWHMVIAAYNCGPGNMKKAIQRAGGKKNYWDVFYYLPTETRGFVPAFIAAAYIMNYSQDHGFFAVKPEMPINSDTVLVCHELHLGQASEVLGVDMATMQMLNPKYRRKILPAAGGPYALRLPDDKICSFITLQDSILNFKQNVYLAKNNMDKEPIRSVKSKSKPKSKPVEPSGDDVALTYTVKSGDNLGFISSWYEVGINAIKDWNGLASNSLRSGQSLTVYVPKSKAEDFRDINGLTFAKKQSRVGKENGTGQAEEQVTQAVSAGTKDQFILYTVRSGDNLWTIAQKYPGISHEDIMKLNQMTGSKLQTGQVLKIKRKEG